MLRWLALCLLLVGCNSGQNREIETLRAQLAAASKRPADMATTTPDAAESAEDSDDRRLPHLTAQLDRIDAERPITDEMLAAVADASDSKELRHVSYNRILKTPNAFIGTPAWYRGVIDQISEEPRVTWALIRVDWAGRQIYSRMRGTTPLVAGDAVEVVGYLAGRYVFTSTKGWEVTVPALSAMAMMGRGGVAKARRAAKASAAARGKGVAVVPSPAPSSSSR